MPTSGNDVIGGGYGNDTIDGLAGHDTIDGFIGDDSLIGGAGNDSLIGGQGNDSVFGGEGDDTIEAVAGNDYLSGGSGNDWIYGYAGNETLIGGPGDDFIRPGSGDDQVDGGDGLIDRIIFNFNAISSVSVNLQSGIAFSLETGTDTISNIEGVVGTNFDDVLLGMAVIASYIEGMGGDDSISGGSGNDSLLGGDGQDTVNAGPGNDFILGGGGNDLLSGGLGADIFRLIPGSGNDTILDFSTAQDDLLEFVNVAIQSRTSGLDLDGDGAADDTRIVHTGGTVALLNVNLSVGTPGNDAISLGVGNDTFDGLAGNDSLDGREGDDSLIGNTGDDTLDGFDGTDTLDGGDGNDVLWGRAGNDILVAGAGNDLLTGGAGADRFRFGTGSGNDTITDYSPVDGDTLEWNAGAPTSGATGLDLDGDGQSDDARLVHSGGTVTLLNFTPGPVNGTTSSDNLSGLPWNDTINGAAGDDLIQGLAGNDSLLGDVGDDTLAGGDGADTLLGGEGSDFLSQGGETTPTSSGRGFDAVGDSLSAGSGNDFIIASALDTVDGGLGDDLARIDAQAANPAGFYDLSNPVATAAALGVTVSNVERWFFQFGDANDTVSGSGESDAVHGWGGADSITGLAGNDLLAGGAGADTLRGGAGNDAIAGDGFFQTSRSSGGMFAPLLGASYLDGAGDLLDGGDGDDTIYAADLDSIDAGSGNDVLFLSLEQRTAALVADFSSGSILSVLSASLGISASGVEVLQSLLLGSGSDSIVWADFSATGLRTVINGGAGNDTLTGGAGLESLLGGSGDDVLIGGAGRDLLRGEAGNDRLTGGAGTDIFDVQSFGQIGSDTITDFTPADDGLMFSAFTVSGFSLVDGDGDGAVDDMRINLVRNTTVGTVLMLNTFFTHLGTQNNDTITGSSNSDTILGNSLNDSLVGGGGDDALYGGIDADTLDGGAGSDLLVGGNGTSFIGGEGITDLDAVTYQSAAGQLVLLLDQGIGGSAEVGIDSYIGVERYLLGSGADIVIGSSGAESVDGGAGDDWMSLGDGNDTLFGGAGGNDILVGGGGNDRFVGEAGDQFYGGDGVDEVSLASMTAGVTIDIANGYTLSGGVFGAINAVERVLLGSGDDLFVSFTGVTQVALGAGNDWVADFSAGNNDVFLGEGGNDALYGLAGDDSLDGGAGVDILIGGTGNDTLIGGDGFDWMQGGTGADVFRYLTVADSRTSSGTDAIFDLARGTDTIDLAGIDANTALAGDQAFTIGALAAGQAGRLQITFEPGGSPTWALVQGDVDGDGVSDFDVLVFGNVSGLTGADFVL